MKNNETLGVFVSANITFQQSLYIHFQGGLIEILKTSARTNNKYIYFWVKCRKIVPGVNY